MFDDVGQIELVLSIVIVYHRNALIKSLGFEQIKAGINLPADLFDFRSQIAFIFNLQVILPFLQNLYKRGPFYFPFGKY